MSSREELGKAHSSRLAQRHTNHHSVGPRKAAQPQPVQCSAPPPKSFLGEQLSNFLDFENFEVSTQGKNFQVFDNLTIAF